MESTVDQSQPVEPVSLFRSMPNDRLPNDRLPNDGLPTKQPPMGSLSPFPAIEIAGLQARLIAAGVKVNRIASPDLLGQLEQSRSIKIDTMIVSVLDTDPTVGLNAAIAEAYRDELAVGTAVLAKLINPQRVWVAADPDKSSEWFEAAMSKLDIAGLRLIPLRGDYPQTDPTLMLYTLMQRRLLPGKLPTTKGVFLVDAAAMVAIGRCMRSDSPLRETPLAVRDHFQRRTHLLSVPMGIALAEVLEFLDIRNSDAVFRAGDFLRDLWVTPDTILGNGELVIHPTASHLDANPDPCIHCGWCLEACPTRIHPAGLLDAAQQKSSQLAKRFGIDACIECGICSYVCPTRLPLLTAIRGLRNR